MKPKITNISKQLNINTLIVLIVLSFCACQQQKYIVQENYCNTKYPIVLVHGVLLRDDLSIVKYWSKIPTVLEKNGAKVYLANTDALNSHVENALILRDKILEVLDETGSEKVNIIAHSKGGLESRYMITKMDMADKIASLTTLATPHWGSYHADTILCWLASKKLMERVINLANSYGRISGDKYPDALTAAKNLTIGYMINFNQSVPDMQQVYYQSYGGIVSKNYPFVLIRFQEKLMGDKEGESDGTVSLKSYQWGNFKGVVKSDQDFGVSHFDIVGMKFVSKQSTFDAEAFIIEIAKELKEKGL